MDVESKPTSNESAILGPSIDVFQGVYGALFGMAVTLAIFLAIFGVYLAFEIDRRGIGAFHPSAVEHWLAPLAGSALIGFYTGWATYAPAVNGKRFRFTKTLAIIFFSSLLLLCVAAAVIDQPRPTKGGPPVSPLVMFGGTLPSLFVTIALTLWRMHVQTKDHSPCPVEENA